MLTEFRKHVAAEAKRLGVVGVAVGVLHDGTEDYVCTGVTSVENPLPVDESTIFQIGSIGKTLTASAIMRLVDQGLIDLAAPVRTYVPELTLKDETAARTVTVLNLLNHTAGWQGDLLPKLGDGDDALARYVEVMADLEQEFDVGRTVSYNNASFSLAGRVIEKVTGCTFEQAVHDLLFAPLGMDQSYFFPHEVMTRRFVVGHMQEPGGTLAVARPWPLPRSNAPGGGSSSSVRDALRWARFHLGDGTAADGTRVLPDKLVRQMQEPTVDTHGAIGDYVGIAWKLQDVDGVRLVEHDGDTFGQHASMVLVPERDFAVVVLTNSGPNGVQLRQLLTRAALHQHLGITERETVPVERTPAELEEFVGTFDSLMGWLRLSVADGCLLLTPELKPEVIAQIVESGTTFQQPPPIRIGFLPVRGDRFVGLDEDSASERGFFTRDPSGAVDGLHFGGRLALRLDETG